MSKLWILTEERPKNSVILTILEEYCKSNQVELTVGNLAIKPKISNDGKFVFEYTIENVQVSGINEINVKIVSGYSSFMDYMLIKQDEVPEEHSLENIIFLLEETKTSDSESRNTGIGQRASKFAYANYYCPNVPKYMLYNEETSKAFHAPTDTNIFGTNMMLTQQIKFLGKDMKIFHAFTTIDELIAYKSKMRLPNSTNTPILIQKQDDTITVSGRLSKPKEAGNINHDPNIGTLTCIAGTLRELGWTGVVKIVEHGISQEYVNKNHKNKFLHLCKLLNITLDGINLPNDITLPDYYWHYAMSSEKTATILLHITCQYVGIHGIYENHAGCERSYFKEANGRLIALPKKDSSRKNNLYLPDVVLKNDSTKEIYLIEGKMFNKLGYGLSELERYDSIINEYIHISYPEYTVSRWVTLFGGDLGGITNKKVLIYVDRTGKVYINENAPQPIKDAFEEVGIH